MLKHRVTIEKSYTRGGTIENSGKDVTFFICEGLEFITICCRSYKICPKQKSMQIQLVILANSYQAI